MQILIVECGSQYTQIIARRIRELGVRSEIVAPDRVGQWLGEHTPKGIILSGGAASVYSADAPQIPDIVLAQNVPMLGICFGMHWLVRQAGGVVALLTARTEYGEARFQKVNVDPLLEGIPAVEGIALLYSQVWASHGDSVVRMPKDWIISGYTVSDTEKTVATIYLPEKKWHGVQFHPEVAETTHGKMILKNFIGLCNVVEDWKATDRIEEIRDHARRVIPGGDVFIAYSGGVDSSVAAALLKPVFGERLVCITIDAGNLREGEQDEIRNHAWSLGCPLTLVDAEDVFLPILAGVTDAELKRTVFQGQYREALSRHISGTLVQGGISSDFIESAKTGGALIKTHHNPAVESFNPLRGLFKDEVRELGRSMGLSESITERMPFPGSGLFVRIVGVPITWECLSIVRHADFVVRRIIREQRLEKKISQLVVALLGVRVTGVKGDHRSYEYPVAVRAVETFDFMTARGYQFSDAIRRRINRELSSHPNIACALFDESDKPPRTIEFE